MFRLIFAIELHKLPSEIDTMSATDFNAMVLFWVTMHGFGMMKQTKLYEHVNDIKYQKPLTFD